jgi:hypothetical protein
MQLGFVSAIMPELTLEEILSFAATEGFGCIELMCWPVGKAERRYAGVTHLDVTSFGEREAARTLEPKNMEFVFRALDTTLTPCALTQSNAKTISNTFAG